MGESIADKRKTKDLTQQEMADLIGISRQYYNDIENGKRKPSVSTAKKIEGVLGVDWTIFFTN